MDIKLEDVLNSSSRTLKEGLYAYQTYTYAPTYNRKKPIYVLTYGDNIVAKYDKNTYTFQLGSEWERHISKLIEWLGEYYPGFFTRKYSPDSASYERFVPTEEEAIQFIKDQKVNVIKEAISTTSSRSLKGDWKYIEKQSVHDDIFGNVAEGDYYIRDYGDGMTGYIYPPNETEKLYRAKLSRKDRVDSLGYNVFIELDAAKEFLDDVAVKLTPVSYEEIKQQLEEVDTHEFLEIDIDNNPTLDTTKATITGTLINGEEITFYDSSYLRTQRDVDFIKDQYAKASKEINHMRERGYLGVKKESYGEAFDIADDQYFTRDDLNEFSEALVDYIKSQHDIIVDVTESYITDGVLEVTVNYKDSYTDCEYDYKTPIDMRKIKKPRDLIDKYCAEASDALYAQIKADMESGQQPVLEYLEDAWDYGDDELANIYGGDTGYPDYEEELESESEYFDNGIDTRTGRKWGVPADFEGDDVEWDVENNCPYDAFYERGDDVEPTTIFEALMQNKNQDVKMETASSLTEAEKELQKLGVDLDRADKDEFNYYFNAHVDSHALKENGYKPIHTNSGDPTQGFYTNGVWVIHNIACTGGCVSIHKLGPKAKETIDAGKEFDVFNNSLDESKEEPNALTESTSKLTADSLDWKELSERRRVAQFKLRGCDVEIEEHTAIDGLHYYLYVEDTDLDDIMCNGREFGSAESALEYVYEITAAPEPEEVKESFDINEGNMATYLDEIEADVKKAVKDFMMMDRIGFEENEVDEYSSVSANLVGEHIEVAVGAELSYSSLEDLCSALNDVIKEYSKDAYFEPECPGRIVAYIY